MKDKINIAELLKNCPKGMELDCTIYNGKVCFEEIDDSNPAKPIIKISVNLVHIELLDPWGQYSTRDYSKCVIFPKGKTTWEGFVPPHKFKVGDRVKHKSAFISGIIVKVTDKGYHIDYPTGEGVCYVNFTLEKNYELVPNKFDITTLVPFESRVLVRDCNNREWEGDIYTRYNTKQFNKCYFTTLGGQGWCQCIPYNDSTKHLLGSTHDCDEFYKTW